MSLHDMASNFALSRPSANQIPKSRSDVQVGHHLGQTLLSQPAFRRSARALSLCEPV